VQRLWREKNPEKVKMWKRNVRKEVKEAYKEYYKALYHGELVREPCVVCGEEKSQGHHEDYSKPLDVVWLCSLHHHERHH